MRCWRFCWDYKKIVLTVALRLFQVLHYVFIPMRFVCRSHLTNTKISIDKRRLSHIFVFAAHSPHRNKMNCRNRKNPSNHRFMHLLLIFQFSRKSEETLCDSWVLSTSVCGTGVFSAHTATYSTSESAHETQRVSSNLRSPKIGANFYR